MLNLRPDSAILTTPGSRMDGVVPVNFTLKRVGGWLAVWGNYGGLGAPRRQISSSSNTILFLMTTTSNNTSGDKSISRPYIASQNCPRIGLAQLLAKKLHTWNNISPPSATIRTVTITIVCISDTHDTKPLLPDGDILLHAGDPSQYGLFDEIQAQLDWLNAQPHKHKIIIAGNHDLILDASFAKMHLDRELDGCGGTDCALREDSWSGALWQDTTSTLV